jgi:hypothetical protein
MTSAIDDLFRDGGDILEHDRDTREDMLARYARELEGAGFVVVDMRTRCYDEAQFASHCVLPPVRAPQWDKWLIPVGIVGYLLFAAGWHFGRMATGV